MMMGRRLRRFAWTVHVASSVAWVGAVAAYLVLDLTVATSDDVRMLRAAFVAMERITWWSIVPLAWASLVTGLILSLGTKWGLFRHYWVVLSLVLTLVAVAVLMVETQTIGHYARLATDAGTSDEDLRAIPGTLLHSGGGLLVLLVVLVLNVYKPRGLTRYGWRRQQAGR